MSFKVKYNFEGHSLNRDFWLSKKDLFEHFYESFYHFILNNGGQDELLQLGINNKYDFFNYADWNAGGKDNCYAIGFAFHKYFLTDDQGGSLETQPSTTFIGYCHHNKLFGDFINFLITFFAWWRNDEHCTTFEPYNYGDDFFSSSWAVLVDTSKLFYFTAETVFWWQSFRVKYAIDNIPGIIRTKFNEEVSYDSRTVLEPIRVNGFEFLGYFDENDQEVKVVDSDITLTIKLKQKDFYDYWEKEEKTIKKVIDQNMKKVDPA